MFYSFIVYISFAYTQNSEVQAGYFENNEHNRIEQYKTIFRNINSYIIKKKYIKITWLLNYNQ